jgi:hypothetical protein
VECRCPLGAPEWCSSLGSMEALPLLVLSPVQGGPLAASSSSGGGAQGPAHHHQCGIPLGMPCDAGRSQQGALLQHRRTRLSRRAACTGPALWLAGGLHQVLPIHPCSRPAARSCKAATSVAAGGCKARTCKPGGALSGGPASAVVVSASRLGHTVCALACMGGVQEWVTCHSARLAEGSASRSTVRGHRLMRKQSC